MIILGIDPGTRRVGYGLVKKTKRGLALIDAGILKIKSKEDFGALVEVKNQTKALIRKFRPRLVAIEKLYFVRNQKTGLGVAQARGVVILSVMEEGIKIKEFGPNEIKAGITGYGLADKKAVAKMVKLILGRPNLKVIDDASDALAAAILASRTRA